MKFPTCLPVLFVLGMGGSLSLAQFNLTVDDADSSVVYTRSPSWNKDVWSQQSPQPLDSTNHGSQNPGASATLQFTGTAVYVYGYKSTDHGFRNISVDSDAAVQCDGQTGQLGSRALLFGTSGLSHGRHTITVTHTGIAGEHLNIDYFLVTSGGDTAMLVSRDSHHTSVPRVAIIASSAAAGVVGIFALLIIIFYCIGRRRRNSPGANAPSVLIKRASANTLSQSRIPSSTARILDSQPSSYYPYSSNPSTTQEYNPYQHVTPPMSAQFNEPRGTSVYSNLTPQVVQTVSSRRSPDSRPLSTISQPMSIRSGTYQQGGGYGGAGTQPLAMNYDVHPESLRSGPYQQGAGSYGGAVAAPLPKHYDANPQSIKPLSYQPGAGSHGGAETVPLAKHYDANPESLRSSSYLQGGGSYAGPGTEPPALGYDANPESLRWGSRQQGRNYGGAPAPVGYGVDPGSFRPDSQQQEGVNHGGAGKERSAVVYNANAELRSGSQQQGGANHGGTGNESSVMVYNANHEPRSGSHQGNYGGAEAGPLVMSYDTNAEQALYTHLPEKRRPEEMDPVYQTSSTTAGSSSQPPPRPPRAQAPAQRTYRPTDTEHDNMPPPPGYYNKS